jgi:ferric-dicitrate binding protein FerR (iron transport regulator)
VKHWKAELQLAEPAPRKARRPRLRAPSAFERWARVDSLEPPKSPRRQGDFSGAVAGLVLVATACVGLCFVLYQVTGPRDTFAEADKAVD